MSNETKLIEVEIQIHAQPAELKAVYALKIGLAETLRAVEKPAMEHLLHQGFNCQFSARSVADALEGLWARGGGSEVTALAKIYAAISAIENHPLHSEAVAIFEPLFAERVRLTAAIEAEVAALEAARAAAETALAEAKQKALAAVESDPAVTRAREALAALENPEAPPPPAPFRGRVKVAAEV